MHFDQVYRGIGPKRAFTRITAIAHAHHVSRSLAHAWASHASRKKRHWQHVLNERHPIERAQRDGHGRRAAADQLSGVHTHLVAEFENQGGQDKGLAEPGKRDRARRGEVRV